MLTVDPGPDIAPYHDRQIVILDRPDWATRLDLDIAAENLVRALPAGSLAVEQLSPGSDGAGRDAPAALSLPFGRG